MCVCANKRIKGPLCLWEDDWWGERSCPFSVSLGWPRVWVLRREADAHRWAAASPPLLFHYLPFTPSSIHMNSAHFNSQELKSGLFRELPIWPPQMMKWNKIKNMNNLSINIFLFRPQQTNTATQSVHACPRRAKNTALLRFFADTWGCGRARHQIAYNNRTKQLSCFGHIVQEQYDARWFGHLRCCPCLEIRKCRKNEKTNKRKKTNM